ncbi:MAG: long-chain fatty acid--CoA ligase [Ignavibacteriae bacterium]|nr:MAG: long-chain fatty acid--CoA ligase [Ignavibacteriota bacterium]
MFSPYGSRTTQQIFTLQHILEESCRKYSSNIALSYTDEEPMRYSELKRQVDHLSGFLKNQGVTHGDRVAILGENSPQWGTAYFAITVMGAVVVPILPDFNTSEIHHILRHSGSKVVFISERYYYKIEDLDLSEFNSVILLNNFSIINPELSKATLRQLIAEGSKEFHIIKNLVLGLAGVIPKEVKEDDIASLIYTSGTTGNSKGVMLTHKNIVWNAIASSKLPEFTADDRMLSVLPLAHVYECTLGLVLPITCGSSVYYIKKPPTAAVLLPALEMVKPTAMLTVPLIIEKMYKTRILPEIKKRFLVRMVYKFPVVRKRIHKIAGDKLKATFGGAMRFFGIGGAALAPEVERFLRDAEFPYAIGYGLTETSPLIAGTNAGQTRYRSTGPVVPGLEVRIENQDPKTGIGEIVVRGPSVMKGYYRDPGLTDEVISPGGWFHTGDLGSFDKSGYLYINGRLKNVILGPSGENIYPEVIESVINRLDVILESLVYQDEGQLVARVYLDYEKLDIEFAELGLTDSQARERIKQICEEIKRQVNEQVSSFSRIARVIEQTEPFEKTPTQKIKRYLYAL